MQIDKDELIVVVGATQNKDKYGYRVLMRLNELGFRVVGVNPKYEEIEGVKCFASITNAKLQMTNDNRDLLIVTVVPPVVTEQVVEECGRLGVKKMWMQVGSSSEKAVERAKELGIEVLGTNCIVVDGLGESWGSY